VERTLLLPRADWLVPVELSGDRMTTAPTTTSGERILVVDDEPDIVALVAYHLARSGYRVSTASNGHDAVAQARQECPSLVVLDLMLPGISGYDVISHLRENDATKAIAVLMLTARREEEDRVRGLSLGADDYLTKPFSPRELVLRVGAILRRVTSPTPAGDVIMVGSLRIDRASHSVKVGDADVDLTPTEFRLLLTLAERRGRVQDRGHLLETVWEAAPDIQTRTVDMHVQRLRSKLGEASALIETVRGFGYRIQAATATGTSTR
jgi:two-component system, OmpR family, phosphate regulon response regulator PhoB